MYFAHSTARADRSDWQPLACHLKRVAALAGQTAGKFHAAQLALLAGLAHDLGKYSVAFARRLAGSPERVDHSTAGAQEVTRLVKAGSPSERRMAEMVAYAIAGHHAGLPDRTGDASSLEERLAKPIPSLDPVWRSEVTLDPPGGVLYGFRPHDDKARRGFQLAALGRFVFSALVDADRRDTRAFDRSVSGGPADHVWPRLPDIADDLVARLDRHLEDVATRGGGETSLNRLRARILAHVTARAEDGRGFYTLTVPTGGGKTLTVTRFALGHARRWKLDRIIYAIPFTGARIETSP